MHRLLCFVFTVLFSTNAFAQVGYSIVIGHDGNIPLGTGISPGNRLRATVPLSNILSTPTVQAQQGAGPWINQVTLGWQPGTNYVKFAFAKTWTSGVTTNFRIVYQAGGTSATYSSATGANFASLYGCNSSSPWILYRNTDVETNDGACYGTILIDSVVDGVTVLIIQGEGFGRNVTNGMMTMPVITARIVGNNLPLTVQNIIENTTTNTWSMWVYIPGTVTGSQQLELTVNGRRFTFIEQYQ